MLDPEYFNNKEDRLLEIYRKLENFILKDIARRILGAKKLTATADRLLYKWQQMGKSQQEILTEMQKYTKLSQKELKRLMQDAVLTSWKDDKDTFSQIGVEISNPLENDTVKELMDAEYQKTQGELENLTRTTMNQAQKDLIQLLDEAEMRVSSGVQSYSAAYNDVLDEYAGRGIMIDYPTGAKRTLEAAVRCCVVTSMNQTTSKISLMHMKETGTNLVRVSWHYGARYTDKDEPANHMSWQGKVYHVKDEDLDRLTYVDDTA